MVTITSYLAILNILQEADWQAFPAEEDEETGVGSKEITDGARCWRWWEGVG